MIFSLILIKLLRENGTVDALKMHQSGAKGLTLCKRRLIGMVDSSVINDDAKGMDARFDRA
jgi:hypothetical protein